MATGTSQPLADRDSGEPSATQQALVDALGQSALVVMGTLTRIAAEHDLSLTQLRVLGILRDRRLRMTHLADFLGLDKSTMSGLIDRAERRGLVTRTRSTEDGRAVEVFMTPAGHELAEKIQADVHLALTPMTSRLDAQQQRSLTETLHAALPSRDARSWEEMYRSRDQVFSGAPNGVLVAEVTDLPPGRALDVGCGEGADAIWLALHGWQVTAVDVSPTALERAAATARDVTGSVTWARADLSATPLPAGAFDLVSVQYFPLRRQPGDTVLRGLLAAAAPGGTLLFASHDPADLSPDPEHGFDPDDFYQTDDIAGLLDHDWTVMSNEIRPRTTAGPAGTRHTHDTVLRARRLQ